MSFWSELKQRNVIVSTDNAFADLRNSRSAFISVAVLTQNPLTRKTMQGGPKHENTLFENG